MKRNKKEKEEKTKRLAWAGLADVQLTSADKETVDFHTFTNQLLAKTHYST